MTKRIRYYETYTDDFFDDGGSYSFPENYKWIRRDFLSRVASAVIYALALIFSNIYCRLFLRVRIKGAGKVRRHKGGFFVYANHTQPIGDVFDPALACFPKRIYVIVSKANLALPVIGKLLPYLGALPIPDTLDGMRRFGSAVKTRVDGGHPVVVYPEAHLWDYYTKIRPFPDSAFSFPVRNDKDVFCMTTTYQSRGEGKRPRITLYVDGPFRAEGENTRERSRSLRDRVYAAMSDRSRMSDCEYVKYVRLPQEGTDGEKSK